jgi:hypothetical protein
MENPFTRKYFNNLVSGGSDEYPMGTNASAIDFDIDGQGKNYPWPTEQDRRVPGFPGDPPWDESKAGKHNSEKPTLTDRSDWWSFRLNVTEAWAVGMPHAAAHLLNYLNKGGDITLDMNKLISDSPTFADELDRGYLNFVSQIRYRISKSYTGKAYSFTITSKDINPTMGGWTNLTINSRESKDWYYAIGGYDQSFSAFVTVKPSSNGMVTTEIKSNAYMGDRYNWDRVYTEMPTGLHIYDSQLRRLKIVGFANDFSMRGSLAMPNLTWSFNPHKPMATPIPVKSVRPGN